MKKYLQTVLFLFSLTGFSGCGGTSQTPPIQPSESSRQRDTQALSEKVSSILLPEDHARSLGLRILENGGSLSYPILPNPNQSLSAPVSLEEMTISENEILVHRKLFLDDPLSPNPEKKKSLFLVWPEKVQGSFITTAHYFHRIIDVNHKWSGSFHPKPVWHDTDHHRWFIPISELFKSDSDYKIENVDLNHMQVVTIELARENAPNLTVHIKFQLSGKLPQTSLIDGPILDLPAAESVVRETSRKGWLVKTEVVTNPLPRPFHLWVKASRSLDRPLQLSTTLKTEHYIQNAWAEPSGPVPEYFTSEAFLEIGALIAKHQDFRSEEFKLDSQKWEKITLEPSESLTLEWWSKPLDSAVDCQIPVTQRQNFTWMVQPPQQWIERVQFGVGDLPVSLSRFPVPRLIREPLPLAPPYPMSTWIDVGWKIVGGRIEGEFSREIRLAHPFLQEEDATRALASTETVDPIEFLSLAEGKVEFNRSVGEDKFGAAPPFSCQGIFR